MTHTSSSLKSSLLAAMLRLAAVLVAVLALAAAPIASPPSAAAAGVSRLAQPALSGQGSSSGGAPSGPNGGSLEAAASKASAIGRKIAMSLIALGFAIASIVLVFRRNFKEAAGVVTIGLVAILLATPAGVGVLRDTVSRLFGG
jgi:hypothetical protein